MRKLHLAFSLAAVLASGAPWIGPPALAATAKTAVLSISSKGSEQSYDKTKLTVKAGQKVKLTFSNKSPAEAALQHNWVLVNPGKTDDVTQAALMAGPDKGYIPDSPEIIAHTKLLSSGQSDTIQFTAPATPGDYPFFCTYPGHAATMKGVLQVKK